MQIEHLCYKVFKLVLLLYAPFKKLKSYYEKKHFMPHTFPGHRSNACLATGLIIQCVALYDQCFGLSCRFSGCLHKHSIVYSITCRICMLKTFYRLLYKMSRVMRKPTV